MKKDVTGEILQQRSGVCSICKCRGAAGWRILLVAEYVCLRPSWSIVMVAGLCSAGDGEYKYGRGTHKSDGKVHSGAGGEAEIGSPRWNNQSKSKLAVRVGAGAVPTEDAKNNTACIIMVTLALLTSWETREQTCP